MIDDRREIDLAQFVGDSEEIVLEAENLDEPAKLAHAIKPAAKSGQTRRQLESAAEIKSCAAHADAVEPLKFGIADTVIDDGNATIVPLRRDF